MSPGLLMMERESAKAISHCQTVHWGIFIDVVVTFLPVKIHQGIVKSTDIHQVQENRDSYFQVLPGTRIQFS
jgi:hypothetical protein